MKRHRHRSPPLHRASRQTGGLTKRHRHGWHLWIQGAGKGADSEKVQHRAVTGRSPQRGRHVALGREGKRAVEVNPGKYPARSRMRKKLASLAGQVEYGRRKWIAEAPHGWFRPAAPKHFLQQAFATVLSFSNLPQTNPKIGLRESAAQGRTERPQRRPSATRGISGDPSFDVARTSSPQGFAAAGAKLSGILKASPSFGPTPLWIESIPGLGEESPRPEREEVNADLVQA